MREETFKNPGKEYRGAPFWSLNDRLEEGELRHQIALMEEGWFGGFFLHAREGLTTPYMTEEWMERIEACVHEAQKRGMFAWLYDEDKWPSGFAGGIVTAKRREYRAKALAMMLSERLDEVAEAIRIFECVLRNGKPENLRILAPGEKGLGGEKGKSYLYFCLCESPIGSKWYDGFAYLDTLSFEAVKAFIESTYEAYSRMLGRFFGSTIPGIFTDEPNFHAWRTLGIVDYPTIPWTSDFPEYFMAKKGYDIRDHLPSLFFEVGDWKRIRYDFWNTLTSLFIDAYTKQLFDWCEAHGLKYTGHYLAEETLVSQLRVAGAVMPHYEYMHVPGIDHLGRNIVGFLTVKQVASVANQLGKERVLSETYGCSGQNLSFEDRKWIGDWEYVLGVNFLNHHLSLYTMRGRRKRDYPPNIFYQQPWWPYNHIIEEYFERLSYALSRGVRNADILIVHPIGGAWSLYSPLNPRKSEELHKGFEDLCRLLLEVHRDFELGDESIMARHGRVEHGRLILGRCSYKAVILPRMVTMAEKTLRLLEAFVQEGGLLIAIDPPPNLVEGRPSESLMALLAKAKRVNLSEAEILDALKPLEPQVEISDPAGRPLREVWYHLRQDGSQNILFLANTDRKRGFDLTLRIRGMGRLEEWNPFDGNICPIPCQALNGYTIVRFRLPPVGSKLLVLDEGKGSLRLEASKPLALKEIPLGKRWLLRRRDPNALTLDYCRLKIEDGAGEWSSPMPVWKAHRTLSRLGLGTRFSVKYSFEAYLEPKAEDKVCLVLESPEKYSVKVNGTQVSYEETYGWWIDKTFKRIPIGSLLKRGENTVEITGKVGFYREMIAGTDSHDFETELESAYIIGDFSVESLGGGRFRLLEEDPQRMVDSEDLGRQGYPFFAGRVSLIQELELPRLEGKILLSMEGLHAILAIVSINGVEAGKVFMKPLEVDVTGLLKEGRNLIEIKLVGSLRNLLGPHHHKSGELFSVGPGSFMDELNWTDEYCFVPFGLEDAKLLMES
ncbi:MAG: glycosyl hydrolase [Candidatus Bathyarchaeia archaeon]